MLVVIPVILRSRVKIPVLGGGVELCNGTVLIPQIIHSGHIPYCGPQLPETRVTMGYGSIIYLAALSNVDQELYDAAKVDGAGYWKQMLHITLPGISAMIVMMFIMRMGTVFSVGADKILLLYNPSTYDTADVINTYVYRIGMN